MKRELPGTKMMELLKYLLCSVSFASLVAGETGLVMTTGLILDDLRDDSGADICIQDDPSYSSVVLRYPQQCAMECAGVQNCFAYNFVEEVRRCEIFQYQPLSEMSVVNCTAKKSPKYNIKDVSCSFPFTYNGGLYYQCTGNQTAGEGFGELGCFNGHREWRTCDNLPTNYTARNRSVVISVPSFSSPTPVVSVNGWIIFQQRLSGSTSFNRSWEEYKTGFGLYSGNFWMGLEKIYQITKNRKYKMRYEVMLIVNSSWISVEYDGFYLESESTFYRIHNTGFSGEGGDMTYPAGNPPLDGMFFSTYDNDHDLFPVKNCALMWAAGWWYKKCAWINFNTVFGLCFVDNTNTYLAFIRMMMKIA